MFLYYVRHGDPIYDPDSLTEFGHKQAAALAKRFAACGLDEIYCSTSMRAQMTAQPTCELLKKEKILLDWAHEERAWEYFSVPKEGGGVTWAFLSDEHVKRMNEASVRNMGMEWYKHPYFAENPSFEKGTKTVNKHADELLLSLGFAHDRQKGCYKVLRKNSDRVAIFAHAGFGKIFLSSLLDIPYPITATRLDFGHTGVTVIHFDENAEHVYPCALQWSNDSHLYKENLSTKYNNILEI